METNGGTLPSCWLCIIVLRCVTQMNGFELSPACSDRCQFLGHYSEICDSERSGNDPKASCRGTSFGLCHNQNSAVLVLTFPLFQCVTLGRSFNVFGAQFTHL